MLILTIIKKYKISIFSTIKKINKKLNIIIRTDLYTFFVKY